ncbi:AAA family ATPase [Dactylosporangium vinaceum]|uniref:AAA family ATPase n=1 Tax=Dactylosporangium vinaceum TaxID=53362 RepID=A0ABV5MD28_9ACTN|nr:AAA family ATPase [Dactylosporangium vinaceum]
MIDHADELISAAEFGRRYRMLAMRLEREVLGKQREIALALTCLLADGHLLLEDLPGLGKTRLAAGLAAAFGGDFQRVQGTPDLLPSDVTGSVVFGRDTDVARLLDPAARREDLPLRRGPVFTNILLCDELNRTPPRTQSALLEAMEERQVTIFSHTFALPDPFLVIATQNPVDLDGTYRLPEAQLDRFLMRFALGRPDTATLERILTELGPERRTDRRSAARPVADVSPPELLQMIRYCYSLPAAAPVREYVTALIEATDPDRDRAVRLGASPRAALALLAAARARAAATGAEYVAVDHVRAVAVPVLAHRIVLRDPPPEHVSTAQDAYVTELLRRVETPKRIAA